tara:strand:- start:10752 stop:11243 length:492 start_codon:yes stop_codon:yes gene_type:complete
MEVDFAKFDRYVLDGNALGLTATEAFRRRRPVEFNMPDSIVVSIGYPETIPDSPYSLQRGYDFQPPVCSSCTLPAVPGVPSNADNFIDFIDTALRRWVRDTVFPKANFDRDALYGHSFGGLFVLYALTVLPSDPTCSIRSSARRLPSSSTTITSSTILAFWHR